MDEKIDFMQTVDCIFNNKLKYKKISDKDKKDNFFMVNRKFAVKFYKQAQFFNNKFVDKESALDIWFLYFKGINGTPGWYYAKSKAKKEKESKIPKADRELFMMNEKISEDEFDFMVKYYPEDVDHEIKKMKRFE